MILLDTNAVLWALVGHPRVAQLFTGDDRLHLSPVTLLEFRFLTEVGRLREVGADALTHVTNDPRWTLDSPPSDQLFAAAWPLSWTRDPFDRLLVAHARLRGWRLATGDRKLHEHLGSDSIVEL